MILSTLLAATVLLADTTPAAATAATQPAPAADAAKKTEKPKVICRSEAVIGSLMPKKTCYTVDEMAQRKQDERQNLERMQANQGLKSN